jgi:ubiquinone/menaquinone biosynthesis C-methylase UbiE
MGSPINGFDTIAPLYDKLAHFVFRGAIQQSQQHFLSSVASLKNALIIGGGTGLIAQKLLSENRQLRITYVEASQRMIAISRENCAAFSNRIQFIHGTEENIPDDKYDLVVTAFFFDMFNQRDAELIVSNIVKKMNEDGTWLATDFVNTTSFVHRVMLWSMYAFFKIVSGIPASALPRWEDALKSRLTLLDAASFYSGFIKSCKFVYHQ